MSGLSSEQLKALSHALLLALPGWEFARGPEPFGWAPGRHLRARLQKAGSRVQAVIRRSSSREAHEVETRLYHSILPGLSVRTARLLAVFDLEDDGAPWMVLEDLGLHTAVTDDREHRAALLSALGRLHAEARWLVADGSEVSHMVPRFAAGSPEHGQWRDLLRTASSERDSGIRAWAAALLDTVLSRLAEQPLTLIHGDLDYTNVIVLDEGVALVDWEKARVGPASLDIGAVVETLASRDEFETYRPAFNDVAGEGLSRDELGLWVDLGDAYDCFRWICYCLRVSAQGRDPGERWRELYYRPRLLRLNALAASS